MHGARLGLGLLGISSGVLAGVAASYAFSELYLRVLSRSGVPYAHLDLIASIIGFGLAAGTAVSVFFLMLRKQAFRLDGETRCRTCGYILRGITEPRCPECGQRI